MFNKLGKFSYNTIKFNSFNTINPFLRVVNKGKIFLLFLKDFIELSSLIRKSIFILMINMLRY